MAPWTRPEPAVAGAGGAWMQRVAGRTQDRLPGAGGRVEANPGAVLLLSSGSEGMNHKLPYSLSSTSMLLFTLAE